jgi:predicted nuclease of predicted toxin-antitoxin system
MIRLYADEQFPLPVVERLRSKGYDVLTVKDAGKANQGISDEDALAFASSQSRAVITQNRRDFIQLHNQGFNYQGIVVCTKNLDWDGFASEIDLVLAKKESIMAELVRVNRPSR